MFASSTVRRLKSLALPALAAIMVAAVPESLHAQAASSASPVTLQLNPANFTLYLFLSLAVFLPALLISMTPFVRLAVVFYFLRQALGTQGAPSNQVLMGLAFLLTIFLMQPVGMAINEVAVQPFEAGQISSLEAVTRGAVPLRNFMLKFSREKDLELFASIAKVPRPNRPQDLPIHVVAPAYILSELKIGFQIGAILFLPFLVIDLVVASITTSVGMFQLPPVVISTPLKLLLFVVVDGWNLIVGSLMRSFV